MINKITLFTVLVCAGIILSGCATMRYPMTYKVAGTEVKKFQELSDEKALELVAMIYNIKDDSWEDGIARDFSLQEYIGLLSKRNSKYLKNSGVFQITYNKVEFGSWKDDDLVKLYDTLKPRAMNYYIDAAAELTEIQNTERIVYLTTESAIVTEMKKRNNTRNFMTVITQVLMGILTIGLAMI